MSHNARAFDAFARILEDVNSVEEIIRSEDEYYFRYVGVIFSVAKFRAESGEVIYTAYIYPLSGGNIRDVVRHFESGVDYDGVPLVRYSTDEADNAKFKQILPSLYSALAAKHLRLDDIFDRVLARKEGE